VPTSESVRSDRLGGVRAGAVVELRLLRAFVAVAQERSFVGAARRLHLTESPVSRQVARLERLVGLELLDRTAAGVEPSPAGALLLPHAEAVLRAAESLAETARAHRAIGAAVHVGVAPGPLPVVLSEILGGAGQGVATALAIEVEGDRAEPRELLDRLSEGAIDVALIDQPPGVLMEAPDGVAVEPLLSSDWVLLLSATHRLAARDTVRIADLAGEAYLAPRSGSTFGIDDVDWLLRAGAAITRATVDFPPRDERLLVSLVAAGLGIAVAPAWTPGLADPAIAVRPVARLGLRSTLSVAWIPAAASPEALRLVAAARGAGLLRRTLQAGDSYPPGP
jgi:DNA-binding transcriptional LysR family regulator